MSVLYSNTPKKDPALNEYALVDVGDDEKSSPMEARSFVKRNGLIFHRPSIEYSEDKYNDSYSESSYGCDETEDPDSDSYLMFGAEEFKQQQDQQVPQSRLIKEQKLLCIGYWTFAIEDESLELKVDYMIKKEAAKMNANNSNDDNERSSQPTTTTTDSASSRFLQDCEVVEAAMRILKYVTSSKVFVPKCLDMRLHQLRTVKEMLTKAMEWNVRNPIPVKDFLRKFSQVLLFKRSVPRNIEWKIVHLTHLQRLFHEIDNAAKDNSSSFPQKHHDPKTSTQTGKQQHDDSCQEVPLSSLQALESKILEEAEECHSRYEILDRNAQALQEKHLKRSIYRKKLRQTAKRQKVEETSKAISVRASFIQLRFSLADDIVRLAIAIIRRDVYSGAIDTESRQMQLEIIQQIIKQVQDHKVGELENVLDNFIQFISLGDC
mmetsp:Transcript_20209/g.31221  ORF Transcript_20209/g.31221 Transcript_20209/m.31221 type:complete len:434 (-) Transcript_20209:212-1513(-)|eukprot:CAMPEP_0195288146 /NCGR_PEP_ID=MMETSP0707-20130614/4925_1 /TAXON_ID=33640 /ORGANISM="Asterionellopsis glacialis, Strain CCMP134" /LENGTH=433 /DNA_ID=CAMNT_0040347971 /DNA_START=443 /DNA_END=1744 /DNA_ORIENTATION=+